MKYPRAGFSHHILIIVIIILSCRIHIISTFVCHQCIFCIKILGIKALIVLLSLAFLLFEHLFVTRLRLFNKCLLNYSRSRLRCWLTRHFYIFSQSFIGTWKGSTKLRAFRAIRELLLVFLSMIRFCHFFDCVLDLRSN